MKRLIIILLIASLSAVIFTACSRDNSNSETTVNEEEITTTKKDKDTMVEPTTKKHVEKETTTEPIKYAVDSNGSIIWPEEKIDKITVAGFYDEVEYTLTDITEVNKFIDRLKNIKFIKTDNEKSTGTSFAINMYNESNKQIVTIGTFGKISDIDLDPTVYRTEEDLNELCREFDK